MSKFCTKCGAELPNDAKFCKGCGAKCEDNVPIQENTVETISPNDKEKVVQIEKAKTTTKEGFIKKLNPTVMIIAGMVLLTVIIVVFILIFGMKASKNSGSKEAELREGVVVDDDEILLPIDDEIQEVEDMMDDNTSEVTPEQTTEEEKNTSGEDQMPVSPEQPDQLEEVTIIDYDTAFKKFVEDPYLNHIPFPGYGDFVSIESQDQFSMAILINVDEEYVKAYAKEETPRNGYTQNAFEAYENGVYQYIADNGDGQTCQVIYKEGKMMILVGESSAFNR